MLLPIAGLVIYILFAIIIFKGYCYQDKEYTLKSFYYAILFPITLTYQHFFNGGLLE